MNKAPGNVIIVTQPQLQNPFHKLAERRDSVAPVQKKNSKAKRAVSHFRGFL